MLVMTDKMFKERPGKRARLLSAMIFVAVVAALITALAWYWRGFPASSRVPEMLSNRMMVDKLSGRPGSTSLFQITVPPEADDLLIVLSGEDGEGTADVYVKFDGTPTTESFDAKLAGSVKEKLITIRQPQAGTYTILVHGGHGAYSDQSLLASYGTRDTVFKVGMHAHRLFNGGDQDGPASSLPKFQYGLIRDWDISHLHDAAVWKSDGSIDFTLIEKVYAGHARQGAKVIKTFGSVPTWASRRPDEPNKQYPSWPGSKSGPRNLDEYEDYVYRFVSRTRDSLWAVEGWNEPYACPGDPTEFTTMTPTELADVQKRIYRATKRASPAILVFSPAQAYVCGIPTILNARTSEGEPIWKYFDALAWHPYNRSAKGNAGPSFAREVGTVRNYLAKAGLRDMPVADTEHGWLAPPKEGGKEFYALSDAQKGQVLYDTAKLAKNLGLLAIVWYGYDNDMIGKPMTSPAISRRLQQMYSELNTP